MRRLEHLCPPPLLLACLARDHEVTHAAALLVCLPRGHADAGLPRQPEPATPEPVTVGTLFGHVTDQRRHANKCSPPRSTPRRDICSTLGDTKKGQNRRTSKNRRVVTPRKNLPAVQAKRERVIRLRAEGKTWDEIARLTGYSNASAALKAWKAALKEAPDLAVSEIRAAEAGRLEIMDSALASIISQAPVKTTSIGRTQWDVRTCTCSVKARTDRDHAEDCQVQPVLDQQVVISALAERRRLGESYRKLTGADAAAEARTAEGLNVTVNMLNIDRVKAGFDPIVIPERPPGAPMMPVEEAQRALRADMDRRRHDPAGGLFVPPGVAAKGAEAIHSWLTSQAYYAKLRGEPDVIEGEVIQ